MQTMQMSANTANTKTEVIYPELSYKIVGIAFKIQNVLGRFCTERQYGNAFEEELKLQKISYSREEHLPTELDNKFIGNNWADFIIDNIVVIELKAKPFVEKNDYF